MSNARGMPWWLPGLLALLLLCAVVAAPVFALALHIDGSVLFEPLTNSWLRRVIAFSFFQATLSTLLSVGLAIPLAHVLARRDFPGRSQLLGLFSLAFIIPTIVAVFGIVAVYGVNGWINQAAQNLAQLLNATNPDDNLLGSIYGLKGILLAHVFFNLPFATRVLLQSIEAVPQHQWKLAAQIGMSRWQAGRLLEWPAFRPQLPGLLLLIFSLCFTSFAIVLTLGGGPRATTIEVAIYQALRFDFNLGAAVALATVQLFCCGILVFLARGQQVTDLSIDTYSKGARNSRPKFSTNHYQRDHLLAKLGDYTLIAVALAFVITPMLALATSALRPELINILFEYSTLKAAFNTLWVALASGILCLLIALGLLITGRHLDLRLARPGFARVLQNCGILILVIPPIVLGTGLFLLLRPVADVFALALVLVVLINAVMGLPFALRIIGLPLWRSARRYDRLGDSLGITGLARLRIIEWPVIKKPLMFALAVSTTLSAGDLTAIALFGSERVTTLPLLLYQRMGSYRMYEAAATALLLMLLCLILFRAIERLGR